MMKTIKYCECHNQTKVKCLNTLVYLEGEYWWPTKKHLYQSDVSSPDYNGRGIHT